MNRLPNLNIPSRTPAGAVDASAITISGLCLIHCLALPVLAGVLPMAGVWAEAEWVHKVFVLLAVPISGYAVFAKGVQFRDRIFIFLVTLGLSLLIAGAFIEALHDFETLMTAVGALFVIAGHLWRWRRHREGRP